MTAPFSSPALKKQSNISAFIAYLREVIRVGRWRAGFAFFLLIFVGLFESAGLMTLAPVLEEVAHSKPSSPAPALGAGLSLGPRLTLFAAFVLLYAWSRWLLETVNMRVALDFVRKLRSEVFQKIAESSWSQFLQISRAHLQHLITDDLNRVAFGTKEGLNLISNLLILLFYLVLCFFTSWKFSLAALISGTVVAAALSPFNRRTRMLSTEAQTNAKNLHHHLQDHLSGMKEVKVFGIEQKQKAQFDFWSDQSAAVMGKLTEIRSSSAFAYQCTAAVLTAFMLYFGVLWARMSASELIFLALILSRAFPRCASIHLSWLHTVQTMVSYQNAQAMVAQLEPNPLPVIATDTGKPFSLEKEIELRSVSFRYPGAAEYAVHNLSVKIPAGTISVIKGQSGTGKTTLSDLLMGLISPQAGSILIDGIALTESNAASWRRLIGYVPQQTFLFNASIKENLLLSFPTATETELWRALDAASVGDFVRKLPGGLNTIVEDCGRRLSGGERQRIALARALLRNPSLLVLDESTSSLDSENELNILRTLLGLKGKLTVLFITHREKPSQIADQVITLGEHSMETNEI